MAARGAPPPSKTPDLGVGQDVGDLAAKRVELAKIPTEQLPEQLRKLTPKELEKFVTDLQAKRADLTAKITKLTQQRQAFLLDAAKKSAGKPADSFDTVVTSLVREQAAKKGMKY